MQNEQDVNVRVTRQTTSIIFYDEKLHKENKNPCANDDMGNVAHIIEKYGYGDITASSNEVLPANKKEIVKM